jgi:hypothetical protein
MVSATAARWVLAALFAGLAAYHVRHVVARGGARVRDVDVVHGVMGLAMAAFLTVDVGPTAGWALAAVFAVATLWFAVWALDPSYGSTGANVRQSLCCVAMTGMVGASLAAPSTSGALMAGMGGGLGMSGSGAHPGHMTMSGGAHALLLGVLALQVVLTLWAARDLVLTRTQGDCPADRPHLGAQLAMTAGGACMVGLML